MGVGSLAWRLGHVRRLAAAHQHVDQRGLAHVGPAHDGDLWPAVARALLQRGAAAAQLGAPDVQGPGVGQPGRQVRRQLLRERAGRGGGVLQERPLPCERRRVQRRPRPPPFGRWQVRRWLPLAEAAERLWERRLDVPDGRPSSDTSRLAPLRRAIAFGSAALAQCLLFGSGGRTQERPILRPPPYPLRPGRCGDGDASTGAGRRSWQLLWHTHKA